MQRDWDDLADVDPFWAVVSLADRKHGRWSVDEFFATGEKDVTEALSVAHYLNLPAGTHAALDFGCGLGRTARALASHFDQVLAVDVSPEIIDQARTLNASYREIDFQVLLEGGLPVPEQSIDFVYSSLVLQHQPSRSAVRSQIHEFLRVLKPGGVAVFQMPAHIPVRNRLQPRRRLYHALRSIGTPPSFLYRRLRLDPIRMLYMSRSDVELAVTQGGAR